MVRAYRGVHHLTGAQRNPRNMQAAASKANGLAVKARYGGVCPYCDEKYAAGQRIYNAGDGWGHRDCAMAALEVKKAVAEIEASKRGTRGNKPSTWKRKKKRSE